MSDKRHMQTSDNKNPGAWPGLRIRHELCDQTVALAFRFRRHQPSRPPPAKIRPDKPVPMAGAGTAAGSSVALTLILPSPFQTLFDCCRRGGNIPTCKSTIPIDVSKESVFGVVGTMNKLYVAGEQVPPGKWLELAAQSPAD